MGEDSLPKMPSTTDVLTLPGVWRHLEADSGTFIQKKKKKNNTYTGTTTGHVGHLTLYDHILAHYIKTTSKEINKR